MRNKTTNSEKAVVFIDLLAFSNRIQENPEDAIRTLSWPATILNTKGDFADLRNYDRRLRELVENNSISSFESYISFSDSIFIVSDDVNMLLPQLSSFLLQCFNITAHVYLNNFKKQSPIQGEMYYSDSNSKIREKTVNYYPALFRGGIALGEVTYTESNCFIRRGELKVRDNIAGEAIVRAVELEKKFKGPKIILDHRVFESIDRHTLGRYIKRVVGTDLYELLWPNAIYSSEERFTKANVAEFKIMLTEAINLWKPYCGEEHENHYISFIKLIVDSTLHYIDTLGDESAKDDILRIIKASIPKEINLTL